MLFCIMSDHCGILRVIRHNHYLDLGNGSKKFGNHWFNRYAISRSNLYSLQSNVRLQSYAELIKSKISNCNTLSMLARVGTCIYVSTGTSCAMSLKRKRFPSDAAKKRCTKY